MGKSKQTAEVYSRHHRTARRYGYTFGGIASDRIEALRQWSGRGKQILDVGCRDGLLSEQLAAPGNNVIGVDIDWEALRLGVERRSMRGVVWCDVSAGLPFRTGSFDVVNCAEILEHLPHPRLLLEECARVLRLDGVLCGSVPNAFRLKNRLLFLLGRDFELDPTHLHQFSPNSLARLLSEAGFAQLRLKFVQSRWLWLHPKLTGHDICFRARRVR